MDWYYYIAVPVILSQLFSLVQGYNNYRYALAKYKKKRFYRPKTALLVPCKGWDCDFQKNITSFFNQDYENYLLLFVVGERTDPAYNELCKLKNQLSQSSKARDVQVLIAGESQSCGQKIHNLLYCYERVHNDVEVLAFADSDVCVRSDWLSHIVYPLRKSKNGVASGYRWFIPEKNNLATLALSAVNARIAQLLGNSRFNQAWGGSMAIRVDVFRRLAIDKIWSKAVSDDLSLSVSVKKAGMKVAFVPACLVASYTSATWGKLFEFARRQFLITRISTPGTWWFGLCASLLSVLGLWGGVALAIYGATQFSISNFQFSILVAVPGLFFANQMSRAILRQKMISKLLEYDWPRMKVACAADILLFWLWSLLLLVFIISSAFGRVICWRGIRYKLLGPTETIVISR